MAPGSWRIQVLQQMPQMMAAAPEAGGNDAAGWVHSKGVMQEHASLKCFVEGSLKGSWTLLTLPHESLRIPGVCLLRPAIAVVSAYLLESENIAIASKIRKKLEVPANE